MYALSVVSNSPLKPIRIDSSVPAVVSGGETDGSSRATLGWEEEPHELVRIQYGDDAWSFWPDQVSAGNPIYLPQYGVAISTSDERRSYDEIVEALESRGGRTALQSIESAAEETYDHQAATGRRMSSPTWLGLGRDYRMFAFGFNGIGAGNAAERIWDWIAPQWHGRGVRVPDADGDPVRFHYMFGRGQSSVDATTRRLRDGVLPILDVTRRDGGITYELTALVALERSSMLAHGRRGTPYLLADGQSDGHMFTEDQLRAHDELHDSYAPDEEVLTYLRVRAINTTSAPAYAFLKVPEPHTVGATTPIHDPVASELDPRTGVLEYASGGAALIARLGGRPITEEEIAHLLQPGESIELEVRIPHEALSAERLSATFARDFDSVESDIELHWRGRLAAAASIEVPDARIDEMIRAGLLHLDLVTYGLEPHDPVAPTIGIYAPIGSESAPIIQFYDSMGWTTLAERSLDYFLEKQHPDGFMQNFGGYMLETEATLWSLGEHYRYTRDRMWLGRAYPHITRAVGYVLRNRRKSQQDGVPFGLMIGKTSDPDDPFASFMLNGFAALGLSRAAELAGAAGDDANAALWADEAAQLRDDIVAALDAAMSDSPVVPLGDGRWTRSAPPWAGPGGPVALRRDGSKWYTHGTFFARDSLNGAIWLLLQEVIDARASLATELIEVAAEIHHVANGALSQPYYSEHALAHLRRGEVKAFLAAYYASFAGLADPETYSFWEHFFHASPHKTHEEAWFLMQTRWMLYLEEGDALKLFAGVPSDWFAAGKRIAMRGVRSTFGPVTAELVVSADGLEADVVVDVDPARAPRVVVVRFESPTGRAIREVSANGVIKDDSTVEFEVHGGSIRARIGLREAHDAWA